MIYSPYSTERTKAQIAGRAEKAAIMNYNGKPWRTRSQKSDARRTAVYCKDGAWRSDAPVNYHPMSR